MEITEFGPMTPDRRAELEGDEEDPFDARGKTLRFRSKEHHVALRTEQGRLIASSGFVFIEAEVARARFDVVGLGGVIVARAYRGRGYARQIVEAAVARARTFGPAFMLLFCLEDRVGLYQRLGFQEIVDEVLVQQPEGYAPLDERAMQRTLRADAKWPGGQVKVHSLPF